MLLQIKINLKQLYDQLYFYELEKYFTVHHFRDEGFASQVRIDFTKQTIHFPPID